MKRTKLAALLAAIALTLFAIGCGGSDNANTGNSNAAKSNTNANK
jgi:hypothetical protein